VDGPHRGAFAQLHEPLCGAEHKTASHRMRTFLDAAKQVEFARRRANGPAGQDQTDAAISRAKGA